MSDDPQRADFSALAARLADRVGDVPFVPEPDVVEVPRADSWAQRRPGQIPKKFLDAELADFRQESEEARTELNGWAVNGWTTGRNLLIVGPVGVGKSRAAVAACRRAHGRGQSIDFVPVVEAFTTLRQEMNGGPAGNLARWMSVGLLILDDLGTERPTDWTAEQLYALINRRWLEELPIIGTTNLPLTRKSAGITYEGDTLDEVLGDRMFSRLVGGAALVRLSGPDRRRKRP